MNFWNGFHVDFFNCILFTLSCTWVTTEPPLERKTILAFYRAVIDPRFRDDVTHTPPQPCPHVLQSYLCPPRSRKIRPVGTAHLYLTPIHTPTLFSRLLIHISAPLIPHLSTPSYSLFISTPPFLTSTHLLTHSFNLHAPISHHTLIPQLSTPSHIPLVSTPSAPPSIHPTSHFQNLVPHSQLLNLLSTHLHSPSQITLTPPPFLLARLSWLHISNTIIIDIVISFAT